jgi:hypothetical protein
MTADPAPLSLPDDLQARLAAAGVTDEAGLQAALAADPALAADLQAYVQSIEDRPDAEALFAAFAKVKDSDEMLEFWRSVPAGMEEPFIQAVEDLIASIAAAGQEDVAADLRARLDSFRQVHQNLQQAQEMPPTTRAVIAFVQAEDGAAAEALFAQQRHLLQPYEAQQTMQMLLDQAPDDTPAEIFERLTTRATLLLRLRGAAPTSAQPATPDPQFASGNSQFATSNSQLHGDLYQAGRDQHLFSAHAEGGGAATVVNNFYVQNLERRWSPPTLAALKRDLVPRHEEMQAIRDELARRGNVAVTGQAAQALAVQGMAGVGKTVLAQLEEEMAAARDRE